MAKDKNTPIQTSKGGDYIRFVSGYPICTSANGTCTITVYIEELSSVITSVEIEIFLRRGSTATCNPPAITANDPAGTLHQATFTCQNGCGGQDFVVRASGLEGTTVRETISASVTCA
jgi:hypothetical protein